MFEPGRPFQVNALGKTWTLGRITLALVRGFRDWIKEQLPDPVGPVGKIFDKLPEEEQIRRVKEAERIGNELKCFSMQSQLAQDYLRKEEGQAKWAQLWLSEHHPEIDEVTAFSVFIEAGPQIAKAFEVTGGSVKIPGQGPPGNSQAPTLTPAA